ncbi:hypothetical protein C8R45DRAFT_1132891 [Mycena sanguinolenta]|nr:hypothetical protein C8R45DRAFT_1132891 [Mycena sanguinolenta]
MRGDLDTPLFVTVSQVLIEERGILEKLEIALRRGTSSVDFPTHDPFYSYPPAVFMQSLHVGVAFASHCHARASRPRRISYNGRPRSSHSARFPVVIAFALGTINALHTLFTHFSTAAPPRGHMLQPLCLDLRPPASTVRQPFLVKQTLDEIPTKHPPRLPDDASSVWLESCPSPGHAEQMRDPDAAPVTWRNAFAAERFVGSERNHRDSTGCGSGRRRPNWNEYLLYRQQHPTDPPPLSSEPAAAPPKRGRGRPKGSKNKRTAEVLLQPDEPSTAIEPEGTRPRKKAHLDTASPSASASAVHLAEKSGRTGPIPPLSNLLGRGLHSRSRPEKHSDVPNTTPASSTSPMYLPHTANIITDAPVHSVHPKEPTTNIPVIPTDTVAASSPVSRSVIARANTTKIPFSTSLPTSSTPPSIGFITNIDDSPGSQAFHGEGIGEEEEEEGGNGDDESEGEGDGGGNTQVPKRKPFPEWLKKHLKKFLDELKYDLENTTQKKSRHYLAGTFWLPRNAVWFSLGGLNVKPTDLFLPDFFLWDPLDLVGSNLGVRCPDCNNHHLTRNGVVKRPRRVVDIDNCFWIIGWTYACKKRDSGCGARFRSWDQRILERLPLQLAAEFPAHLTWRSGLSTRAFGVVRSCFQHGMGAEEVADLFRMQHLRRYDEIRLQYLRTKVTQMKLPGKTYEPFLPFEDRSVSGFHGFTPSGQWLRDIYDGFIESYRDVLNQHTAMQSARICAIDHSHKLAKHVFKVDGVPIFTALLTVTNEKGEIKVCVFVATKSHSQYEDALRRLADDLTIYGHELPELFPVLLEKVSPVEKHSQLPLFVDPDCVARPSTLDDTTAINNVMRSILDDLLHVNGNYLVVGFGSEWNIDITSHGRLAQQGPPAVLQIAYKNNVHVLQIGEMLKRQALPFELLNLLREPRIIKAGRSVNADLCRLATACGQPPGSFTGSLELGNFAKDRFLIAKANMSLVDLVASVLGQRFPQHYSERISSNWSDSDLTTIQQQYAARDAYAALVLYRKINETPLPVTMDPHTPCGASVLLLTDDNKKVAARGVISPAAALEMFNGANLTPTRTVITVREILIPGAIIGQNDKKKSLTAHGNPPFDILAHRSHVRVLPGSNRNSVSPCITSQLPSIPNLHPPESSQPTIEDPLSDLVSLAEDLDAADDGDEIADPSRTQTTSNSDPSSAAEGASVLGEIPFAVLATYALLVRSRVLKDVFHVFNMIYISRTHGLRVPFSRALRDALLIPHPADKAQIEAYLKTKNVTWQDMLRFHPKWRHCRHTIPPPEDLYPLVHSVFMAWGPLKDSRTGLPLFNSAAWKVAKNILELIQNGFVSDPPNVQLYYCIGFDEKAGGLPIYRCVRGTNMVEGGVHTHLLAKLPSHAASVRHMVACLLDFVLRHNLHVGHFNSTGKKYIGHDSIWLSNSIQELEIALAEAYNLPPTSLAWVNGNLYQKTEQSVGIIKIPQSVCEPVQIQPYNDEVDSKRTQKQQYLARMQGTRKPVLPVHTVAEKMLFNHLMQTSPAFQSCKTAIYSAATAIWNREAESKPEIFYKLEEQLTSYLNGNYKDSANVR